MHSPCGVPVEQARGHLRAAGVVDADEQHLGYVFADGPVRLRQRSEPVGSEPAHQSGQMRVHPGGSAQRDVGLKDAALDGLPRHHTVVGGGDVAEHDVRHEKFRLGAVLAACELLRQRRFTHRG